MSSRPGPIPSRSPKGSLGRPRRSAWLILWEILKFPFVFVWGILRLLGRAIRWFVLLPVRFVRWLSVKLRFSLSFKIIVVILFNSILVALLLLLMVLFINTTGTFYFVSYDLFIVLLVLGVLGVIFLSYRSMKRILEPIHEMNRQLQTIQAEDLSRRLDTIGAKDELRDLSLTINQLLERIDAAMRTQRAFVSNASHELRTPLSILRGYSDLLERWGAEDPQVLSESLRAITQESRDMSRLVEQLLFLSRADDHRQAIAFTDLDLSALCEDLVQETIVVDRGRHPVHSAIAPGISYSADETLMKECLRIFLENARKYTPPGREISLTLSEEPGEVAVEIADRGIGIEPEHQRHIFERFYRSDSSRTRSTGGSGLGLSIAKSILDMHTASVELWSEPGVGTHFRILLPKKRV